MKLGLGLIEESLRNTASFDLVGDRENQSSQYKVPMAVFDDCKKDGHVLILERDFLLEKINKKEELPDHALFVVDRPPDPEYMLFLDEYLKQRGLLAFVPKEQIPISQPLFVLTELFEEINDWYEAINETSYDLIGVKESMEITSGFLKGDFLLVDVSYNIPVCTGNYQSFKGLFDKEGASRIKDSEVNNLAEDPVMSQIRSLRGVHYYDNESAEDQRNGSLFCNMFREGENVYFNRLLFCRLGVPYTRRDYFITGILASKIEKITRHLSTFSLPMDIRAGLKRLILSAVSDERKDDGRQTAVSVLNSAGWREKDTYRVYLFQSLYPGRDDGITEYIMSRIEQVIPYSCAVLKESFILLVQNTSHTEYTFQEFRSNLAEFLRENLYKAAISLEIGDFLSLKGAYEQANAALKCGQRKNPMLWYYLFEDYILEYLLYKCTEDIPSVMLCHPKLKLLYEYDENHKTELTKTLKILSAENFNVTHAAKSLFIHRTSLQDRINRIRAISGLDLDDPDTRFLILLHFRLG